MMMTGPTTLRIRRSIRSTASSTIRARVPSAIRSHALRGLLKRLKEHDNDFHFCTIRLIEHFIEIEARERNAPPAPSDRMIEKRT
jgi:hypothetical protein